MVGCDDERDGGNERRRSAKSRDGEEESGVTLQRLEC